MNYLQKQETVTDNLNDDDLINLICIAADNSTFVLRSNIRKIDPCRKVVWVFSF